MIGLSVDWLIGVRSGCCGLLRALYDPNFLLAQAVEVIDEVARLTSALPLPYSPAMAAKNPHAVKLGRLGGLKAGIRKLSPKRRQIARKAALARWQKKEELTP